jgi:carbohydrate kinase (thermoresistant glucokinase family)
LRAVEQSEKPTVIACSALRRHHRDHLRAYQSDILFVWVDVGRAELERRVANRPGHFMPPSLLADQLANFEPPAAPERFVRIDGTLPKQAQVDAIEQHLRKHR